MIQRQQGDVYYTGLMPTKMSVTIDLQPIPYIEHYTHPITHQQRLVQDALATFDVRVTAGASDDYEEDRGQVTHEATTSYPCIYIERGFDDPVSNMMIPVAQLIMFAVRNLQDIQRVDIQLFGTDYKDDYLQLADYVWHPEDGILHENALSQQGWEQLLLWRDNKLQDWPEKNGNLVLARRFLFGTVMRYVADYVFNIKRGYNRLQAVQEITCLQDIKTLEPWDYQHHVSSSLSILKQVFEADVN